MRRVKFDLEQTLTPICSIQPLPILEVRCPLPSREPSLRIYHDNPKLTPAKSCRASIAYIFKSGVELKKPEGRGEVLVSQSKVYKVYKLRSSVKKCDC